MNKGLPNQKKQLSIQFFNTREYGPMDKVIRNPFIKQTLYWFLISPIDHDVLSRMVESTQLQLNLYLYQQLKSATIFNLLSFQIL